MLLPTLLILMLVAGRCAAAALLSGPGPRADGRMEMRKVLETVGRHPLTRTVSEVSGHAAKSLERGSRSHQGPGQYVCRRQIKRGKKALRAQFSHMLLHPDLY